MKKFRPSIPNHCCHDTSKKIIEELMEDLIEESQLLIKEMSNIDDMESEEYLINKVKFETVSNFHEKLTDKFKEVNERHKRY
ncbi:hypothetical protein CD798_07980 [Bacillaceae bacterium SAOS 7]|nr:hypothetical protein CD798_07980 [Bacillaceae bacterium SAOS 7]